MSAVTIFPKIHQCYQINVILNKPGIILVYTFNYLAISNFFLSPHLLNVSKLVFLLVGFNHSPTSSFVKMCVSQASISADSISTTSVNYPVNWSGDRYEHNIRVTHYTFSIPKFQLHINDDKMTSRGPLSILIMKGVQCHPGKIGNVFKLS